MSINYNMYSTRRLLGLGERERVRSGEIGGSIGMNARMNDLGRQQDALALLLAPDEAGHGHAELKAALDAALADPDCSAEAILSAVHAAMREPTLAMLAAAAQYSRGAPVASGDGYWRAMLAASPLAA